MRNCILLLLLLCSQICFGQDTLFLNKNWKPTSRKNAAYFRMEQKEGNKWVRNDFYYPSKLPQMKGSFSSLNPDVEDGIFEWYYSNGQLEHRGNFINGKESGEHLWYYADGLQDAKETYRDGVLNGPFEEYHSNGKLMSKTFYVNGLQNGWTTYYKANGTKESEGIFKNGNRNGEWKYFDNNENVKSTTVFKTEYVIPEAKLFLQLPSDEWSLSDHTTSGQNQYTFKRSEVTDAKGQSVIPSIKLLIENAKSFKQDIESYSQEKQLNFKRNDIQLEKKVLTSADKDFPVSYKNALLVTANYSDNGVEHILYMCYIITKENKGIQLYMDSVKDKEDKYKEEFLKTLQSIKELI